MSFRKLPARSRRLLRIVSFAGVLAVEMAAPASAGRAAHTTVTVKPFNADPAMGYEVQVLRRPKAFKVESEDSYVRFRSLHWKDWGGKVSVGRGKVRTCDYSGTCSSWQKVTLRASRRHRCADDYDYRRLTVSRIPEYGNVRTLPVEPAGCADA